MGKSTTSAAAATELEFAKLHEVLDQTADDAISCLKTLKSNLSDYDSRHGHHFKNTAKGFMRDDLRKAKDTAKEMQHVATDIRKHKPSEKEITSARTAMQSTADAMAVLKVTARKYDQQQGQSTGMSDMVDNALGGTHEHEHAKKDEKDEKSGGFFGTSKEDTHTHEHEKDSKDSKDSKVGGLFGGSKDKKGDKQRESPLDDLTGKADTVEAVVKKTLSENFNGFSPLKHQISAAEKTDSPSMVDRAKEAMHEVKDKLKGDSTSSPTKGDRHYHEAQNAHQSTKSA